MIYPASQKTRSTWFLNHSELNLMVSLTKYMKSSSHRPVKYAVSKKEWWRFSIVFLLQAKAYCSSSSNCKVEVYVSFIFDHKIPQWHKTNKSSAKIDVACYYSKKFPWKEDFKMSGILRQNLPKTFFDVALPEEKKLHSGKPNTQNNEK